MATTEREDLSAVEDLLNTTISSPTHGWYEVFRNEDPDRGGDIHLAAVEYFGTDRFITADNLAKKMAGGWEKVYDGTTRGTEGSQ